MSKKLSAADKYDRIPLASQYKEKKTYQEKPNPAEKSSGQANYKKQVARMQEAAANFVEEIIDICIYRIDKKSLKIEITPDHIREHIDGVPRDVLLYGHRTGHWRNRNSISELEEMPFVTAQRVMHEKGWYLIEESDPDDPTVGRTIVFRLYQSRPDDDHPYFNKPDAVWHTNNMFPVDLE